MNKLVITVSDDITFILPVLVFLSREHRMARFQCTILLYWIRNYCGYLFGKIYYFLSKQYKKCFCKIMFNVCIFIIDKLNPLTSSHMHHGFSKTTHQITYNETLIELNICSKRFFFNSNIPTPKLMNTQIILNIAKDWL